MSRWITLLLSLLMACTLQAQGRMLRVAAAADLQQAFPELQEGFAKKHPGIQVVPSFGSSGNLTTQLLSRAPFDVFMAADMGYPQKLVEAGLVKGPLRPYAKGHLVLWARTGASLRPERGWKGLTESAFKRLAIANPKHAPYGRAAEAALRQAGLWETLQPKLAFGENVSQTAQFAQSGAADGALIALSLAKGPSLRSMGSYWEVSAGSHPPLIQGAVVLQWTTEPDAAEAWMRFLLGAEGQAILARFGFGRPE